MSELRFYTFVNCELRTIQQGVQSFHVGHEMFMKYDPANSYTQSNEESAFIFESELRLKDWARNHKTLIILNGGGNTDINDKYRTLEKLSKTLGFPMPFDKFNEDERSLGGLMTACGCVLPDNIYKAVDYRKAATLIEDQEQFLLFTVGYEHNKTSFYVVKDGKILFGFKEGTAEHELITMLKSCSLAR